MEIHARTSMQEVCATGLATEHIHLVYRQANFTAAYSHALWLFTRPMLPEVLCNVSVSDVPTRKG
jgi:hypothetical protein